MNTAKQHGLWFHLFDVGLNIVIIVGVVAVIRTFLVSPFQVEGSSMLSTLEHKEYIIINKLAYRLGSPKRGDVVVFRPPTSPDKPYVKRVIGMPGDTVTIEDGEVFIQAGSKGATVLLEEEYLNAANRGRTFQSPPSSGNTSRISYTVPEGQYFLLGDNRTGSLDSRSFRDSNGDPIPFVEEDAIMGRVWVIALPISKIHALEPPIYDL
ncbi:MAG: signal peptidase I [Candidatus Peregrinibacteria bacterium]|nr:signal peptidase I [Candidatus Peregrinibacteria bacterium]MCB9808399.1 signal peptidase I [Candidatus Peribacteria bacterium]